MTEPDASAPADSRRSSIWFLMLLALLVIGAGIGLRDPWPPDEPAFTLAAKQMLDSGDWLFPHRGRELFTDAPPMLSWLQAESYKMVRDWRVAFLLPSLFASLLTLIFTYDLGRRLWNRRAGLYAAVLLLFVFQFTLESKRGQTDALVMLFATCANWGMLRHFLRGPAWKSFWFGCLAIGLGVLAAGFSAALIFLMMIPYLFAAARHWPGLAHDEDTHTLIKVIVGVIAFVLPPAIWMISVSSLAPSHNSAEYSGYLHDVLFRHTDNAPYAQLVLSAVPAALLAWLPLTIAYIPAAPRLWRDISASDARVMLPLTWSLMLLLCFFISPSRHDVYSSLALPMLAIAIAPYLDDISSAAWARIGGFALSLVGGLALVGVGAWALLNHFPAAEKFVQQRGFGDLDWIAWVMIVAIGCAMLLSAIVFRLRRGVSALLGAAAGIWLIVSLWAFPMLNDSDSAAAVIHHARDVAGRDGEIGMVAWKEQDLLMAQGPVRDFGFKWPWDQQYREAIEWQSQASGKRYIFIQDDAMSGCVDTTKATRLGRANHHDWWLFKSDAVVAGCVPTIKGDDSP